MTLDIDEDCSFHNRAKFQKLREETRAKVASHLGTSSEEIALVRNTSEANNTINNGLSLRPGDEVVIWDQNHPTNNVAWDVRAARFGFNVVRVSTPIVPLGDAQLVETFASAFNSRTKVLAITHLSNTSGVRLPVSALCEIARQRDIFVHVDGAQTWGALEVNLREMGCDSYSASSHKWLVGPKEVGILFVKASRIEEVWPNVVAPGWGGDEEPDVAGARKFESLGQRDDAAIVAVGKALDFQGLIGPAQIEKRVLELSSLLKEGLKELGLELVTPLEPELSGGVCVVKVQAEKRQEIVDRLYYDHGIAVAPTGGLRICPHIYNTMAHIKRTLESVKVLRGLIV
jgi:selenocysteine lyase/cysteine desulfurase